MDRILNEQGTGLDLNNLLIFSAVVGFAGSLISLAMSKFIAKRSDGRARHRAAAATPPRRGWSRPCASRPQAAGIGMPEVGIFDAPDMNAFATGANRNNALVAVSSGLLRGMSQREAEAVLAHEVSHVANGDMVTLTLIQGVVNTFVMFLVARDRLHGRPRRVQDRARPWSGIPDHDDRRATGARHSRQHDRHVVLASARVPRRRGWRESGWSRRA